MTPERDRQLGRYRIDGNGEISCELTAYDLFGDLSTYDLLSLAVNFEQNEWGLEELERWPYGSGDDFAGEGEEGSRTASLPPGVTPVMLHAIYEEIVRASRSWMHLPQPRQPRHTRRRRRR
jgi:hypothetical protein